MGLWFKLSLFSLTEAPLSPSPFPWSDLPFLAILNLGGGNSKWTCHSSDKSPSLWRFGTTEAISSGNASTSHGDEIPGPLPALALLVLASFETMGYLSPPMGLMWAREKIEKNPREAKEEYQRLGESKTHSLVWVIHICQLVVLPLFTVLILLASLIIWLVHPFVHLVLILIFVLISQSWYCYVDFMIFMVLVLTSQLAHVYPLWTPCFYSNHWKLDFFMNNWFTMIMPPLPVMMLLLSLSICSYLSSTNSIPLLWSFNVGCNCWTLSMLVIVQVPSYNVIAMIP